MPADYISTARALALPISPRSASPLSQDNGSINNDNSNASGQSQRLPWTQHRTMSTRSAIRGPRGGGVGSSSNSNISSKISELRGSVVRNALYARKQVVATFRQLTPLQRVLAVLALLAVNALGILFIVYNEDIFAWLAPVAESWRDIPFGWTILWAITFVCAFPPMIGYSTSTTVAGFVYGFPRGWLVVATANVAGSLVSFVVCRTLLAGYVQRLVGHDRRFAALALTLKHDGLKILVMLRLCPLPYSLSNGAFSTFHTVDPLTFALATAIASPKLMVHVFIGAQLADIAERGGKMDARAKAINYISIALGLVVGAAVGWIIYQRTMKRAKQLEIEEREALRQAADGGRGARVQADFLDLGEDDDNGRAAALMDDDDISLWDNDAVRYSDNFSDDEDNPFARGDLMDEEATVRGDIGQAKSAR